MRAFEFINEKWSDKYKRSINCSNPKGFSQRAHCQGRKKNEDIQLSELNIPQTLNFIKKAHGDQLYGKLPYWTHPRAVAMTGKKIFGNRFNSDAVKVAFLHDVVEDTNIGLDELSKLDFAPEVIEAVGLLTKDKTLGYSQNIERIINSGNPLAMMVKYADNYENWTGDKSDWDPDRAAKSQKKYLMSLNMLGDKLGVKHHIKQDVAEGEKNVVKSVKVGNFRHDLVDTGMGWQVRIYNGDELYDTGLSKNSEQKGLAALEDAVAYTEKLTRTKRQGVAENFADGKNPGRKGLAKRSGVPTKASVSRLRQIAKSSSGEKQRMSHWLANMKAGKKK